MSAQARARLLMRADAKRILVVSPGSLTEQWQDELLEKFGVQFEIFSREKQEQCASGNYFDEQNQLICRLDQLSRNEEYQEKLSGLRQLVSRFQTQDIHSLRD